MKSLPALLPFFLLALLVGCSTPSGSEQGQATGRSVEKLSSQVAKGDEALSRTMEALNALVNQPGEDLRESYKNFDKAFASLQDVVKDIRGTAADLQKMGKRYFPTWQEEIASIGSEELRAKAEERRAALESRFDSVIANYEELKNSSNTLLGSLTDVQTVLKNDLTSGGLQTVRPTVDNALSAAEKVRGAISSLQADFGALQAEFSPMMGS